MSELHNNTDRKRFELEIDGHIAYIEYLRDNQNTMYLSHTEVPRALEGKGVGSKIVALALDYLKEYEYRLAPLCPFVAKYLTKHPEWQSILAKGYNVG